MKFQFKKRCEINRKLNFLKHRKNEVKCVNGKMFD